MPVNKLRSSYEWADGEKKKKMENKNVEKATASCLLWRRGWG